MKTFRFLSLRGVLMALATFGIFPMAAEAADPRIRELTKTMDCKVYRLSETRQRVLLTAQNTIPGAPAAWALVNEGPGRATIFASNGDRMSLPVFDGKMTYFAGDARYRYSVGLRASGKTINHATMQSWSIPRSSLLKKRSRLAVGVKN